MDGLENPSSFCFIIFKKIRRARNPGRSENPACRVCVLSGLENPDSFAVRESRSLRESGVPGVCFIGVGSPRLLCSSGIPVAQRIRRVGCVFYRGWKTPTPLQSRNPGRSGNPACFQIGAGVRCLRMKFGISGYFYMKVITGLFTDKFNQFVGITQLASAHRSGRQITA